MRSPHAAADHPAAALAFPLRRAAPPVLPPARAIRAWALGLLSLLLPVSAFAGPLVAWSGGATPALVLKDLAGREVRLEDFRGRAVLVNFWATWCPPCVQEMPSMQRLRDRLAAQGFEVLGVNVQENPGRIQPFVDRLALSFPVVRDHDGSVRAAWGVRVFPSSFVVGPDRRIALSAVGEIDWDDPEVEAQIRRVMAR